MRYLLILMMMCMTSAHSMPSSLQKIFWQEYKYTSVDGLKTYISLRTMIDYDFRSGLLHLLYDLDEKTDEGYIGMEYYVQFDCVNPESSTVLNFALWTEPKATGSSLEIPYFVPKYGNVKERDYDYVLLFLKHFCYNELSNQAKEEALKSRKRMAERIDEIIIDKLKSCRHPCPNGDWPLNTDRISRQDTLDEARRDSESRDD